MTWVSWWACRALPAMAARLGPGAQAWLPVAPGDKAAGVAAARAAARFLPLCRMDPVAFAWRHAVYHAADRADVWAMSKVGRAGADRWVSVEGELPAKGAYLALTLHYGAGMWAHAAFARSHARSRWLYARPAASPDRWVRALTAMRLQALEDAMGHPPLPTGGSAQQMLDWWRQGGGIMALYDAPPDGRRRCVALLTQTLGCVQVPRGLFGLAVAHGIPVYFYRCLLDDATGRRRVQILPPVVADDVAALTRMAAAWLDASLRADPAAWHFWAGVERLQSPPPPKDGGAA